MKNRFLQINLFLLGLLLVTGCASPEKMLYFQDKEGAVTEQTLRNFEPKIQVGDELEINVSALDPEAALPFNLYKTPIIGNVGSNAEPFTYLVNAEGLIHFPVLGKLQVAGLTSSEINRQLTLKLKEYLNDPIVNIRLMNFKVTVLGEVKSPGTYAVPNERITILEAIGRAGDLTIQGQRKNVLLIRETDGKRTFETIDLTNKQLFSSPSFYLSQNDVIYVEPNKAKMNSSNVGANTGVIISSASILISIISLLLR